MKRFNLTTLLDAMQVGAYNLSTGCEYLLSSLNYVARLIHKGSNCGGYEDENYKKRWDSIDDKDWTYNTADKRMKQMSRHYLGLQFRILARDTTDANYLLQTGSYNKLI